MRIAMVGPFGLHPNKTMSSRALGLARPLAARGHEVALFMPPWQTPEEDGRAWVEDGVALHYTQVGSNLLSTARNLEQAVLAWQPEVVHGFKPKAYSGMVLWWFWQTQRTRLRLVVDLDDWEGWGGWNDIAPYSAAQKRFFAWQEAWGMGHAHAVTVASRALQSIVWSKGVSAEQVFYLPNGSGLKDAGRPYDPALITAKRRELDLDARPVLLLYSRLFEFDTARLARILQTVRTAMPDLAILSIGTGLFAEDSARLREEFRRANLLDAVVDLGWVDEIDLPLLLRTADVALYLMDDSLINRCKCPVKLADLLAAGVPVVAEAVGQVTAYVQQGVNGCLRAVGDEAGLAADLVDFLADPHGRRQAGTAGQAWYLTHFDWEKQADVLEGAYGLRDK
jgi:glycosyltransferase involved in cell wall biosynthesis